MEGVKEESRGVWSWVRGERLGLLGLVRGWLFWCVGVCGDEGVGGLGFGGGM